METEGIAKEINKKEDTSNSSYKVLKDEVNLKEIIFYVRTNLRKIYITTGIFFILGVIVALLSPKEYTASTTLLPERNSPGSKATSGMLQNFGIGGFISGSGNSGELGPDLYPQILSSTPFLIRMIDEEIYFAELDSTISVYHYFTNIKPAAIDIVKKWTIGIPSRIINWISGPNKNADLPVNISELNTINLSSDPHDSLKKENEDRLKKITRSELSVTQRIKSRISINSSSQTIKVSSIMPDPVAAAILTDKVVNYLTEYLVEYKVGKLRQNLEFIQERYSEAEVRFSKIQNILANFRDQNINLTTARARSEEQRLQAEYDLAFSMFKSLAQQLEQAKIELQEETPIFNVLEPVQIPINKSSPDYLKSIILFTFFGIFIGFTWIFGAYTFKIINNYLSHL